MLKTKPCDLGRLAATALLYLSCQGWFEDFEGYDIHGLNQVLLVKGNLTLGQPYLDRFL